MLVVWPTEAAAEEALARDLPSGTARLVDACWPQVWPAPAPRNAVDARLALRAACAAEGSPGRGHGSAVARFVAQAERAGVGPSQLRGAPGPLPRILARLPRRPAPAPPAADEVTIKARLTWEPADVDRIVA